MNNNIDRTALLNIAIRAAVLGGNYLMDNFGSSLISKIKSETDIQLKSDLVSAEIICSFIAERRPDDAIFSEETEKPVTEYLHAKHLWIIDPLDGTNNYAITIPYFGVSISFFDNNILSLGVINDPVLRAVYTVTRGNDVTRNDSRIKVSKQCALKGATISVVNDYSYEGRSLGYSLEKSIGLICKRIVKTWAPAMDLCRVAGGSIDGMVCLNGYYLDTCTGLLMVEEAGGVVRDLSGREISHSSKLLERPISFVAASSPELLEELLSKTAELF